MSHNASEPADESIWFKSSYGDRTGGTCVEVADLIPTYDLVAIRDSKRPNGPALALPPNAFTAFVDHVGRTPA